MYYSSRLVKWFVSFKPNEILDKNYGYKENIFYRLTEMVNLIKGRFLIFLYFGKLFPRTGETENRRSGRTSHFHRLAKNGLRHRRSRPRLENRQSAKTRHRHIECRGVQKAGGGAMKTFFEFCMKGNEIKQRL
jgi:hypothetical protein